MVGSPVRERCAICGQTNQSTLEIHHIVPQRYGGSDHPDNLVKLCGSCHNSIEAIYDDDFYQRLSSAKPRLWPTEQTEQLGHELEPRASPDREFHDDSPHIQLTEETTIALVEVGMIDGSEFETIPRTEAIVNLEGMVDKLRENHSDMGEGPAEEDGQNAPNGDGDIAPLQSNTTTNTARQRTESGIQTIESNITSLEDEYSDIDDIPVCSFQKHTLIHCGYCNTAFLEWNAADAAKHLQLEHHIEDPYEVRMEYVAEKHESDMLGPNKTVRYERPLSPERIDFRRWPV